QLALGGDPSLADPGALPDPGIGRIEPRRQLVVSDDPLREIAAAPGNLRAQDHNAADCSIDGARLRRARSSPIFWRKPLSLRSAATPMALAKPNASVEPWLLTAIPASP